MPQRHEDTKNLLCAFVPLWQVLIGHQNQSIIQLLFLQGI